jgi:hypothetical protein
MKHFYKILLICMVSVTPSFALDEPIVQFQDEQFKNLLLGITAGSSNAIDADGNSTEIDTDGDGEIQISEALAIHRLTITGGQHMLFTGLEEFVNLERLTIIDVEHSIVDIGGLPNLQYLELTNFYSSIFESGAYPNLTEVMLSNLSLSTINFSGFGSVEQLFLSHYSTSNLDLSGLTSLKNFSFYNINVYEFTWSALANLESFAIFDSYIIDLNIPSAPMLEAIAIIDNSISNFSLTAPQLREFTYNNFNYSHFDFSVYPNLEVLSITNTFLTSINVEGLNLDTLHIENSYMENLNLSALNSLGNLYIINNPYLYTLNIKGNLLSNDTSELSISGTYFLNYICVDEPLYDMVAGAIAAAGFTNVNYNSNCDLWPSAQHNRVAIDVYNNTEYHNNCADNNFKFRLAKLKVVSPEEDTTTYYAKQDQSFEIPVLAGNHTVSVEAFMPAHYTVATQPLTFSYTGTSSDVEAGTFCLEQLTPVHDIAVDIYKVSPLVGGQVGRYKILVSNYGSTKQTGIVSFMYDESLFDYINSSPWAFEVLQGELKFFFADLLPGTSKEYMLHLSANSQYVQVGQDYEFSATTLIDDTDVNPNNNSTTMILTGTPEYTYNTVACLEGHTITTSQANEYLHYVINFKNESFYGAENVVISNAFANSNLDLNTLIPLGGSHLYTTRIKDGKVDFLFEGIHLSSSDENNRITVAFKIKPIANVQPGMVMTVSSVIYSGEQSAVATAPYVTTIADLSVSDHIAKNKVVVYPNPAKTQLFVSSESNQSFSQAMVYDSVGKLLFTVNQNGITEIEVNQLQKGAYFVKLQSEAGVVTVPFLKE